MIYNFGEAEYYYDQFYEPFRAYDRPIFAIPGNHDGAVTYTHGGPQPDVPSLQAFIANFCTPTPGKPQDAGGLARTTMTQPGVYFTLDAPMVSIIGLYTNVLEGPGVLTDEGGHYPALKDDRQYDWLVSELQRLAPLRKALDRAVILACHHPPASADVDARRHHRARQRPRSGVHRGRVLARRDPVRARPHLPALLAQRRRASRSRTSSPAAAATTRAHRPGEQVGEAPRTWNDYTLLVGPTAAYGYLTVTVDMSDPSARTLTFAFTAPGAPAAADTRHDRAELSGWPITSHCPEASGRASATPSGCATLSPDERVETDGDARRSAAAGRRRGASRSRVRQLAREHGADAETIATVTRGARGASASPSRRPRR